VISEVVDDLSDKEDRRPSGLTTDVEANAALEGVTETLPDLPNIDDVELASTGETTAVVCIPARSALDEAVAIMLTQLLQKHGIPARVESVSSSVVFSPSTDPAAPRIICLSYLDGTRPAHMRYLVRRWRRKLPSAKIVLCCWLTDAEKSMLIDAAKADVVVTTLRETLENCLHFARARSRSDGRHSTVASLRSLYHVSENTDIPSTILPRTG
jgi:hypothetical protein